MTCCINSNASNNNNYYSMYHHPHPYSNIPSFMAPPSTKPLTSSATATSNSLHQLEANNSDNLNFPPDEITSAKRSNSQMEYAKKFKLEYPYAEPDYAHSHHSTSHHSPSPIATTPPTSQTPTRTPPLGHTHNPQQATPPLKRDRSEETLTGNRSEKQFGFPSESSQLNIFYEGDAQSEVDAHFTKSIGQRSTYNDADKVTPLSERNLPASFWDQNHNNLRSAASLSSQHFAAEFSPCASAPSADSLTGALHQLAASCAAASDWHYPPSHHQQSMAAPNTYASGRNHHYNYSRFQAAGAASTSNYWSRLAAAGHMAGKTASDWQNSSSDYHQAAAAAAVLQHHGDISTHPYYSGFESAGVQESGKDFYWPSTF